MTKELASLQMPCNKTNKQMLIPDKFFSQGSKKLEHSNVKVVVKDH